MCCIKITYAAEAVAGKSVARITCAGVGSHHVSTGVLTEVDVFCTLVDICQDGNRYNTIAINYGPIIILALTLTGPSIVVQHVSWPTLAGVRTSSVDAGMLAVIGRTGAALIVLYRERVSERER